MVEIRTQPINAQPKLQERLANSLIFFFLLITLGAFVAIPILATKWLKQPFIGSFVGHTLMLNPALPMQTGTWALQAENIPSNYRLTAIDGQPIADIHGLQRSLRTNKIDDVVRLTLSSSDAKSIEILVKLQALPFVDRITYLFIPYLLGLVYLVSSIWVFSLRRNDPAGRAFTLFSAALAINLAGLFDIYTTNILTYLWTASLGIGAGALIHLSLVFPEEIPAVSKYSFLRWSGYLLAAALIAFALPTIYDQNFPTAFIRAWRFEFILLALAGLMMIFMMSYRRVHYSSPVAREQARFILWGAGLAFLPLILWFLYHSFQPESAFSPLLLLPLIIFSPVTAYSIIRYRVLNTDFMLSQIILYTLLSVLAVGGYALLVSGISLLAGNAVSSSNPLVVGIMVFVLALLLDPVRTRLRKGIDRFFFRGQAVYRQRSQSFSRELTQVMDINKVFELLQQYATQGIYPSQMHIFVFDALSNRYVPASRVAGSPSTDIQFPATSPLVSTLTKRNSSLHLGHINSIPASLQAEAARLALLNTQLYIPLPGQHQLVGWLALGPRRSGETYTHQDLLYLEGLCHQAALAIERAQVVQHLEQRVQELDVLTNVAHGVNITLAFNDMLELIYAQTCQIIKAVDFRIALLQPGSETFQYVFYLKNDERLAERENTAVPVNQGLDGEVIRLRRPLRTEDYEYECRGRGLVPDEAEIYAWMGVPLNAGAETIGSISLGARDPSTIFTEGQENLLQAIADQAAGAIVKARLLAETERRARQLATLNDIGQKLTSTLEINPLLKLILDSAVEILACEAGSLFMIDEQTDELVFEVTVGPVADDLIGRRLPPGTGIVGRAAREGKALIANEARRQQDWFKDSDEQTGFTTRDLIVVPIQLKDHIVGVIEVINKRDGSPFTSEDQDLLATFTNQAAVAIENARLYTQTDQALSARVEEMAIMQRIDRELNTSLDVKQTMELTLNWALRHAKADAGLIGLIENGQDHERTFLQVLVTKGYEDELAAFESQDAALGLTYHLPLEQGGLSDAVRQAEIQVFARSSSSTSPPDGGRNSIGETRRGLLDGSLEQVLIPIRRQQQVIGLLMLESRGQNTFNQELVTFLTRLSDHAAIAIANAQFYADLQAANIAKSEFVSLVSHELKTPMTSIKGYADLLAKGAVGPVSDAQADFLSTIRSNVNRMATLVSDLADVSRIEADRMRLEFRAIQLDSIVAEVTRSSQAQIDAKKQVLKLEIPQNIPPVWGDHTRLIQVLANLVSNANKYTPAGKKITLSARVSPNTWDAKGAPKVLLVSVADQGYGISPKDQGKIFQKFFRSEDQNIRNAPGTGLGLNITRHLVEMQGGRIWFESTLGEGTTFFFTIPLAADD